MKRYRDDSVKPGRGIDGSKGENWTRANATDDPWAAGDLPSPSPDRSYSRNSSRAGDKFVELGADSQNLLRQKPEFMFQAGTRSVWDDTCGPEGNGDVNSGFSGPIRYGVNKPQSSGASGRSSH